MTGLLSPGVAPYPAHEPVVPGSFLCSVEIHSGRGANSTAHAATLRRDLLNLSMPLLVCMGDLTENGLGSEDATALAVINGLPATAIRTLVGNHDDESLRGGAAAQAAWGLNALNWTFDLGTALLIGVSPDAHPVPGGNGSDPTITLSAATLAYIGDRAAEVAPKDVIVACHAPLPGPLAAGEWAIKPEADVLALLDAHSNITCWLSGHVHQGFDDPNIARLKNVGSRSVVNANASAIAYVNPGDDASDPVRSLLVTPRPKGVDLRIRDHTLRVYVPWPDGAMTKTLIAT